MTGAHPSKRRVLQHLSRQELIAAVERAGTDVVARRARADLVDGLVRSARVDLAAVLSPLSLSRLKQLCRQLGADDSGRQKAVLIGRLVAPLDNPGGPVTSPLNGTDCTPGATNTAPPLSPPSPRSFQSFREMTDFLWQNAERLRGAYKHNEYDKVILPLLVIRRLDCVLEKTKEEVLARWAELSSRGLRQGDPAVEAILQQASGYPFYNIAKLDFARLKDDPSRIAQNLRAYLKGFSPNARDIVEQFKFDEQLTRLHEAHLLYQIVDLFAGVNLHPDEVSNHVMGSIFEELIRRFNEKKNEEAGDHYTPRDIIRLMVDLLFTEDDDALRKPGLVRTLFDPACGTGGMLSVAEEYLRELNPQAKLEVFGQELNAETYAMCKSDMMIKGQNPESIARGNSFSEDGHVGRTFDYMLSNPPFGIDWKNVEKVIRDEQDSLGFSGRFGAGLPRINDGALLFLQHMISKMKPVDPVTGEGGSRIGIVFNGSPLFTGDTGSGESEIRRWILENDWLEVIVALPDQLFYNTGIATYIWVLTNRKPARRKGKVQLVYGVDLYQKMRKSLGNKRNEIGDAHRETIARIFGEFVDSDVARIFDNDDFGYRRILIERPLRLNFHASPERMGRLRQLTGFRNLAGSTEKGPVAGRENDRGATRQEAVVRVLQKLQPRGIYKSRALFEKDLEAAMKKARVGLTAPLRKAILSALSERDESADVCRDAQGRIEADGDLRDEEHVPLKEEIAAYFEREVKPRLPDAWIAGVEIDGGKAVVVQPDKVKIGYEIPITRHFHKQKPLRPLAEIRGEIRQLQAQIQDLLAEVLL